MAKSLMVVGTSSHVGKSVMAAALCRIFTLDGHRVAPFKAQNMSLNSAVTPSGREIGRAQAVQAEACEILPNEHMNPVLLKPTGHMKSQIVLQGRPSGTQLAKDYMSDEKMKLWESVVESYEYLAARFDIVVIEGAGSPVEMNLKSRDIANMKTALMANANVLLIADIDRGGVFASVVGTLQLLTPIERSHVKGIIINRFYGDVSLFDEGRQWLENYTGVPVLGVIPYIRDLRIDEEDAVGLSSERYRRSPSTASALSAAVIQLPHISNFTDFDPLFLEPDVDAYFCTKPEDLTKADVIIIPGTKSTLYDMSWLSDNGWNKAIAFAVNRGAHLLGICGGFQMLGRHISDPGHIESDVCSCAGLGFFDTVTTIQGDKTTAQVNGSFTGEFEGIPLDGYEIHMGKTEFCDSQRPLALTQQIDIDSSLTTEHHRSPEGHVSADRRVIGTYLHGVLHNDEFRMVWLNRIRKDKGLRIHTTPTDIRNHRSREFDRLAEIVKTHLDMAKIYTMLEIP